MTAAIIPLDSKRPNVYESMVCLWCWSERYEVHRDLGPRAYYPCPNCDETASVPAWRAFPT